MFTSHPSRPIAYNSPILHTPARYVYPPVPTRHLTPACTRTHHITIHPTHTPHSNCTPSLNMCTHPTSLAISHLPAPAHITPQSLDTSRHSTHTHQHRHMITCIAPVHAHIHKHASIHLHTYTPIDSHTAHTHGVCRSSRLW